jgi:hypothetical protein
LNLIWLPAGNKHTKIVIAGKKNQDETTKDYRIKKIANEVKNIELLIDYVKK